MYMANFHVARQSQTSSPIESFVGMTIITVVVVHEWLVNCSSVAQVTLLLSICIESVYIHLLLIGQYYPQINIILLCLQ